MLSRRVTLPVPFVPSELAAWPLASENAFHNCLTQLCPFHNKPTDLLWRDAEREILQHAPGMSVDQILTMRDDIWFDSPAENRNQRAVPLHEYLANLARRCLAPNGYAASLIPFLKQNKSRPDPMAEARAGWQWRWLTFSLPPDVFLSAMDKEENLPATVNALSPHLERCLSDRHFAELHIHVGAGMEFDALWASLVVSVADEEMESNAFASPAAYFDAGKNFGPWLLRASIARLFIACFLGGCAFDGDTDFSQFLNNNIFGNFPKNTKRENSGSSWLGGMSLYNVSIMLQELLAGKFFDSSPNWSELQNIYRSLINWGQKANKKPETIEELFRDDPISFLAPSVFENGPTPEMYFMSKAMRYISYRRNEKGTPDICFEAFFWQVTRLKCLYYRHVTQRPLTPGLLWFVRHYSRISAGRKRITKALCAKNAALTCGYNVGLRSLEIRTTVESSDPLKGKDGFSETIKLMNEYRKGVADYTDDKASPPFEFGVVIHFVKERGNAADHGVYSGFRTDRNYTGNPSNPVSIENFDTSPPWVNRNGLRYANLFYARQEDAQNVVRLLELNPEYLYLVRGVDVCTDELAIPTWVIKPLFDMTRAAGRAASLALQHRGDRVPPLRATAHCGEDFVHLMGGLRRVDEAMDHLANQPGDRLGHAMALGTNPKTWAEGCGTIAMPVAERLLDLVWEWGLYAAEEAEPAMNRRSFLDHDITRLSEQIFGESISPYILSEAFRLLYNRRFLEDIGYFQMFTSVEMPIRDSTLREPHHTWVAYQYLHDSDVFMNGRHVEYVKTTEEVAAMDACQKALRRKAAKRGITVEANPSSNLLIGDVGDLREHPLWRMAQIDPIEGDIPVRVAIGSDDPITFATRLPLEYQILWDTLKHAGLSERDAEQWLERFRVQGMNSRFTLKWPQGLDFEWKPFGTSSSLGAKKQER